MAIFLNHLHSVAAVLSLIATAAWAANCHRGATGMTSRRRTVFIIAQATTGLTALSGLATTVAGPWSHMAFPYLGLVAVAGHGLAGKMAKTSLTMGKQRKAFVSASAQIAFLLAPAALMATKPF